MVAGTCVSCAQAKGKEYTVLVTGEDVSFPLRVSTTLKDTIAIERYAKTTLIKNGYPVETANKLNFNLN